MDDLIGSNESIPALNAEPSLDGLPREIIWDIIEFVPESVFDLKLTCRRFRCIVNDFANLPLKASIVDKVNFFRNSAVVGLKIFVSTRYYRLFELRMKF
ncbi:hypothetical protein PMAYCL1PPCAC_20070, partial [Pristionchus mayeri]